MPSNTASLTLNLLNASLGSPSISSPVSILDASDNLRFHLIVAANMHDDVDVSLPVHPGIVITDSASNVLAYIDATTGVIATLQGSGDINSGNNVNAINDVLIHNGFLKVNGIQVVATQQAAIPDAAGSLGQATAAINLILAALRTHGLIAT